MFGQPKPLASLSSSLLARKGHAKPAMRPQGFGGFGAMPGAHDDLGWNDMGHNRHEPEPPAPEAVVAPIVAPQPALAPEPVATALEPPVLRQREVLAETFAPLTVPAVREELVEEAAPKPVAAPAPTPISLATAKRIGRETQAKKAKAAFTLRLDQDRHLRLRLASALHHTSAQHLVTEALDAFLQSLPEVEELARQLPQRAVR